MPLIVQCVYLTGKTVFATVRDAATGDYWNAATAAFETVDDESITANHKTSLTERLSPFLGQYESSVSGLYAGGAGWAEVNIHDDADGRVIGASFAHLVDGDEILGSADVRYVVGTAVTGISDFWGTSAGTGATEVEITVTSSSVPVQGMRVWVTNSVGLTIYAGPLTTDENGQVSLFLTAGVDYWLSGNAPSGYNDIVREEFEASASGNAFTTTAATAVSFTGSLWDVLPMVLPYVRSCPEEVAKDALRKAAREFFRETEVWRKKLLHTLVEDTDEITLAIPVGAALIRVFKVEVDGVEMNHTRYMVTPEGVLRTTTDQKDESVIGVWVSLMPILTADSVEEWVLETWAEALQYGALYILHSMQHKPWSDRQAAQHDFDNFRTRVSLAVREAQKERTGEQKRVTRRDFV